MSSRNKRTNKQPAETNDRVGAKGRRIESRDIDSLRAHPRQAEFFSDLPEHELAALAEDVHRHGMDKPPEILPDGTVLRGHQRVRVARILGWATIDVIVRDDLKDADEDAILEVFLGDNLLRRHLSTVQQARSAIALANIECDRQDLIHHWQRDPCIVKSVASRLECSERNARRYIAVSRTPLPVQQALESDLLTLVGAAGIGNLRQEVQEKLAAPIAKLLAQIDTTSVGTIKKKIRALVLATFQKTRRQKRLPAPSPADTLYAIKKSLQGQVAEIRERKGPIISQLRGDDLDSGLRASAEFSMMLPLRHEIVHEVRGLCRLALEVVDEIAIAIEPDAEASGSTDVDGSAAAMEAD